jgi:uncharacterized SAM-binding protein YcdF (DUF218 family)
VALALAWAIGLWVFLKDLGQAPAPAANPKADAVVVYTGIGGPRINAGMSLLDEGAAGRLLISGVNPEITREELARLWPGEPAAFECCVDLGWEAQTTVGNAKEVRDWVLSHKFDSLILVTSDYHMPRALLETRDQLPDVTITPYRVPSGYFTVAGRPKDREALRQLAIEYSKFLAAYVKTWSPV